MFCYVIEHRGISAAARAMERPKSSVSAAINRLEAALEVRLLERTTRRVELTEPGEALYQSIGGLFAGLRDARADALAQGNAVAGTLRMGGPHEFCTFQLGPVACSMMLRYPQLKIRIEVEDDTIDPVSTTTILLSRGSMASSHCRVLFNAASYRSNSICSRPPNCCGTTGTRRTSRSSRRCHCCPALTNTSGRSRLLTALRRVFRH